MGEYEGETDATVAASTGTPRAVLEALSNLRDGGRFVFNGDIT